MGNNSVPATIRQILVLGKVRVALPVSLSAITAYLMKKGNLDAGFLLTFSGVFLLACSAMAINQIQERDIDKRMNRTSNRPLPSGKMTVLQASLAALAFLLSGSAILLLSFPFRVVTIGWFTVLWYNLVYTPLKRVTAFAALPGSLVGALPPVIGWLAAGGNFSDHRIWLLAFFFFLGQIPHFWLLILMKGDEYKTAGLPAITNSLSELQLKRITFIWISWTALISLYFIFFGVVVHPWIADLMVTGMVLIVLLSTSLLTRKVKKANFKVVFISLNIFYLYIMILLWLDSLIPK
ncbi:MAG: protoheme IX farnesyltransferase [Bacteroidetes bacterium]|nr:protoheme IX farnesyltransferase [Bacteroidota bacterium]